MSLRCYGICLPHGGASHPRDSREEAQPERVVSERLVQIRSQRLVGLSGRPHPCGGGISLVGYISSRFCTAHVTYGEHCRCLARFRSACGLSPQAHGLFPETLAPSNQLLDTFGRFCVCLAWSL